MKKLFGVFIVFLLLSVPLTLAQEDDSSKQGFFSKIASAFGDFFKRIFTFGGTSEEIKQLKQELQIAMDSREDYSGTYVEIGFSGKEIRRWEIVHKKNGNYYTEFENQIVSDDGVNHFIYIPNVNTLYMSESTIDQEDDSDVNNIIFGLLDSKDVKIISVEDMTYQEKPTYKVHISYMDNEEVYYIEKETYLVVKWDKLLDKKDCKKRNEFLEEYLDIIKEDCISTSSDLENYKINQGINDDFFDLRNLVPDAKIKSVKSSRLIGGTFSACEGKNRRLEDASFEVKLPSYLPEGYNIDLPPESFPPQEPNSPLFNPCYEASRISQYSNVYDDKSNLAPGEKFEVAEIRLEYDYPPMEEISTTSSWNVITQSKSSLYYGLRLYDFDDLSSESVDINGVEAKIVFDESQKESPKMMMLWKTKEGIINHFMIQLKPTESGDSNTRPIAEEGWLTKEEMIAIARSI